MFLTLSLPMVFTLINKRNKSHNAPQREAATILQSQRAPSAVHSFHSVM